MAREQAELLLGGIGEGALVAENHRQTARTQHFPCPAQGHAEGVWVDRVVWLQAIVGAGDAIQQLQQALLAAARLDFLTLIAEHQPADAIIVAERRPADQARRLRRQHRLEQPAAAEEQSRALLDHDVDRPLAFFMEQLGVRLLGACGDAPVDGAHVVAGLIDANLVEIHATPAQLGMMQPDQRAAAMRCGKQRHFTDAMTHIDEFGQAHTDTGALLGWLPGGGSLRLHQATATTSRMRWMTRS